MNPVFLNTYSIWYELSNWVLEELDLSSDEVEVQYKCDASILNAR